MCFRVVTPLDRALLDCPQAHPTLRIRRVHSATRVWFAAPRQVPTSQVPKLPRYFRFWTSVNRSTELVPNLPSSLAAHEAHQQNNRPTAHSPPPAITLALHAPRAPPDLPPPGPRSRRRLEQAQTRPPSRRRLAAANARPPADAVSRRCRRAAACRCRLAPRCRRRHAAQLPPAVSPARGPSAVRPSSRSAARAVRPSPKPHL